MTGGFLEISEEKVRQIVREAQRLLGPDAHPDMVRKVTREVVRRLQAENGVGEGRQGLLVCLLLIYPDRPESQMQAEQLLTRSAAVVLSRAETSYGGQRASVQLVRVPARLEEFKLSLRQLLPADWHALVHPLAQAG